MQNNDVNVRFTIRVPAGVTFIGKTVNGSIRGDMGRADWSDTLSMSAVNGSITLTLPAALNTDVRASTVNGSITIKRE